MSIEIRPVKLSDLEEVTKIEQICFPPEEAADQNKIKSRIENFPEHFFILLENQKIAGFINGLVYDSPVLLDEMFDDASLHDEAGKYQMILSLAVSPEYQHQGYGKQLLQTIINSAKNQHRKGITLTCKKELVSFYAESGFVNQGRSDSVHGGFEWYEMRIIF